MTTDTRFPIDIVLKAFAAGDVPTLLDHIDDEIDLRIDHYRDSADVSWQQCTGKAGLLQVLQRLGTDIFPQGTHILSARSTALGDDWVLTEFHQRFFYGLQQQVVDGHTWIISHSRNGRMDYFRETVASMQPATS